MANTDTTPQYETSADTNDLWRQGAEALVSWWTATEFLRKKIRKSFEYADGNQWSEKDLWKVNSEGRPALTFNELLPQIDTLSGVQRNLQMEFVTKPIGFEDKRLSEIATGTLVAAQEFTRITRIDGQVFDNGIIGGMGVWHVGHTYDDAEDLAWGDTTIRRVNPLCFIFDPWYRNPDFQDGRWMGELVWMDKDTYESTFPGKKFPGEGVDWVTSLNGIFGDSTELGTPQSLIEELQSRTDNYTRVVFLYFKQWNTLYFAINDQTGDVTLGYPSKAKAEEALSKTINEQVESEFENVQLVPNQDGTFTLTISEQDLGIPPFRTEEEALAVIANEKKNRIAQLRDNFTVVSRKIRSLRRIVFNAQEVLDSKKEIYNDRRFPYGVYVSRKYSDEVDSIQGIVYQNIDSANEINKRYSNLLAHLNSSAHSGWLNRASGGADTRKLEQRGARPGIVVEYTTIKPEQIKPVALDAGHFTLIDANIKGLQRRTGINAELLGITTQATVSGRAINARQQGGLTTVRPRVQEFEEAKLDVARLVLSRIQQFWPEEKIQRVIGVYELHTPLTSSGTPIFHNPETGEPMTDDQIIRLLTRFRTTRFDLALKLRQKSDTERDAEWEKAIEMAGLLTSTGRPLGPKTLEALADLSNAPTRFSEALKIDIQQPVNPAILQPGGTNAQLNQTISNIRGGKAGGSPENIS